MKKKIFMAILCLFASRLAAQTYSGDIVGHVADGRSQESLPAVNVLLVEQPTFGAVTDSAGYFIIKGIPVGTYSLRGTIIGYETIVLTNIVVSTGRSTKVIIKLNEQAVEVSGVTVKANYFGRN
jgi:iron complex outermembrane receptor protein